MNEIKLRKIIRKMILEEINYSLLNEAGFWNKLKGSMSGEALKRDLRVMGSHLSSMGRMVKDPRTIPAKMTGILANLGKDPIVGAPFRAAARKAGSVLKDPTKNWQIQNIFSGLKKPSQLGAKVIGSMARSKDPSMRQASKAAGQLYKIYQQKRSSNQEEKLKNSLRRGKIKLS